MVNAYGELKKKKCWSYQLLPTYLKSVNFIMTISLHIYVQVDHKAK